MSLEFAPSDDVRATMEEGVVRITIVRPEKRNALSLGVLRRIQEIFQSYAADPAVRLGVLTGAGEKAFASGGDLIELASVRSHRDAVSLAVHGKAALDAIRTFPVPVIARVNGVALGGGAELAIACDLRFAASHGAIGFIHGRLGITPSWGGGVDLMRLVGYAAGTRLLARAEILDADAARALGLFDAVAPADRDFDAAFEEYLAPMCKHPPQVMRAIKALSHGERSPFRDQLSQVETDHFATTWSHDDHWSAVARLQAKDARAQ